MPLRRALAATAALTLVAASPPAPSDATGVHAVVAKWVATFNRGDMNWHFTGSASAWGVNTL